VGALILSPLFFYFLNQYLRKKKIKLLLISLFILGLIIQFQIAFGGPILILTFILIFFISIRYKKFYHLLSFLIIIIPLATYIIFDLRHNLLQTRSIINFFLHNIKSNSHEYYNWAIIKEKLNYLFKSQLNFITDNNTFLNFLLIIILTIGFYQVIKNQENKSRKTVYFLFLYLYCGYWLIVFFYKGIIWWHYYWPFLPLFSIIIASFNKIINNKFF